MVQGVLSPHGFIVHGFATHGFLKGFSSSVLTGIPHNSRFFFKSDNYKICFFLKHMHIPARRALSFTYKQASKAASAKLRSENLEGLKTESSVVLFFADLVNKYAKKWTFEKVFPRFRVLVLKCSSILTVSLLTVFSFPQIQRTVRTPCTYFIASAFF